MASRLVGVGVGVGALVGIAVAPGCNTEATKDASIACKNDIECSPGLGCLPTRNGLSGECMSPACSKRCNTDADCAGLRYSGDHKECFVCKDVSACPLANGQTGDAGVIHACVDRCEAVM